MDDRARFLDDLTAFLSRNEPVLVETLCALIRAKTVNPPGNEEDAAAVVLERLAAAGLTPATYAAQPRRTNVLASFGPQTPRLLVAAHLDVVPPGDGWTTDPFEPVVREGKVFGRGASDNKGVAAALLTVLPFLLERSSSLSAGAIFAFVADEERGSVLGMEYLASRSLFDCVAAAAIPDSPHNLDTIFISEKGLLVLDIAAHGRAAHGSTPELGSNAILHLFALLRRFDELDIARARHPLHSPATWNLGTIEGGEAPNIVPAKCVAQVDFRYLPNQSADQILSQVRALAADVARTRPGASFEVSVANSLPPASVTGSSPIVRALSGAVRAVLGKAPAVEGMSGTTVSKQLIARGIPAVAFGPGDPNVSHTADEYIRVSELLSFASVLGLLLYNFGRT
ncbi:MAG: ArgE/DapE family deacylase [Planctomycetota bacterium]